MADPADGAGGPDDAPDVVVLREGTEGLDTAAYADALRDRLPDRRIRHARTPAAEREAVRAAPVVTGVSMRRELVEAAESLRLFACAFAGTDHVPLEAITGRGAYVTNASGIHVPGIAEQVLGYVLTFARNLHTGRRRQRRREWRHYQARELNGATVTVVGLGAIGTAVVERLEGFGVHTVGVRYTPAKGGPTDEVHGFDALHEALVGTDYLVLACPLTDTTRGVIDDAALATLPPEAVVVNVARGGVLETDALVARLRRGALRGAALDVTDPEPLPEDHPLWGLENALITPHTGGHNPEHWPRLADIVATNVRALATDRTEDLRNVVAAPTG